MVCTFLPIRVKSRIDYAWKRVFRATKRKNIIRRSLLYSFLSLFVTVLPYGTFLHTIGPGSLSYYVPFLPGAIEQVQQHQTVVPRNRLETCLTWTSLFLSILYFWTEERIIHPTCHRISLQFSCGDLRGSFCTLYFRLPKGNGFGTCVRKRKRSIFD